MSYLGWPLLKIYLCLKFNCQIVELDVNRVKCKDPCAALLWECCLCSAQTEIDLFTIIADLGTSHSTFSGIVCEISRSVLLLDQEWIWCILNVWSSDTYRPVKLCCIWSEVNDRTALIHVDLSSHVWIAVPEYLLVWSVQYILPKSTLRLLVCLVLSVEVSKFSHCHVDTFAFLLQITVVLHSVLVALLEQLIWSLPASHLVQPARSNEHHVVWISVVELSQMTILVDQVVQIWVLPCLAVIDHSTENVLWMCTKVRTISIVTCQQISWKMRDSNDSAVLSLICCRCMCVLLWRYPRIPWAAVEQCVPRVVACVVSLRALLPACCNCTLDWWILLLDVVCKLSIHIVWTCRHWIETKYIMELSKYVIDDILLVLHWEHPDTEVLGLVLLSELCARKSEKWERYLISILLMMLLGEWYSLLVKKAGICHLNSSLESVLVSCLLLELEYVQWLCEESFSSDILCLAMACNLLGILRNHLRTMDNVYNKCILHILNLLFHICCNLLI